MKSHPITPQLREKIIHGLERSSWFKDVEKENLAKIADLGELASFEDGEVVLRVGDPADSFFMLLKGSVTVEVEKDGGTAEVGRLKAPFLFGEVGLLLGKPRTATLVAAEQVFVLRISSESFRTAFDAVPSFRLSVARALASRLESATEMALPMAGPDIPKPKPEVLALLPPPFIQRHRVLPLAVEGSVLTVGFVDEPGPQVLAGVHQHAPGLEINPVRITTRHYDDIMSTRVAAVEWRSSARKGPGARGAGKAKASQRLQGLIERVVAEGASDLHLSPRRCPHWRIDGDIKAIVDAEPLGETEAYDLLEPFLEQRHKDEFASQNDIDFACELEGMGRFRVNLFKSRLGIGAALRGIPYQIQSLETLGLPPVLKSFCDHPNGLVIVTGATGSGKSTTLAAMMDHINSTRPSHIVTLEDPIEFVHKEQMCLIDQREIGGHAHSYARGLRACLREDPDIVLVGEMRDLDTMQLVLEMANTGHLVFTTVHTNSAVSTIERMADMFPANQQAQVRSTLADTLRGVVSQQLCKRKAGGRIAATEVLVGGLAVSNIIRENKLNQLFNVMQTGGKEGNCMMSQCLANFVLQRKITFEEAMQGAIDKKDVATRLGRTWPPVEPTAAVKK
jgi:pilus retraction protein PilT